MLEQLGLDDFDFETVTALDAKSCVQVLGRLARQNIQTPLRALLSVLSFTLLSAFLTGFSGSGLLGQNSSVYSTASALVIAALIAAQCADTVSLCCATIGICADFVFAFFPAFLVILTVSGSSLTGVSTNTLLLGLAQGLNILSAKLFVPLINCFLALSLCSGMRSSLNIDGALRVVRKGLISLISFCAGAFVTVLSVKTAVASRADALGLRSLRFAINSVVPVIGSAISEGLLSIQSYAGLVKSTVGVVGIIGVIALFLPALINVIGWRVSIAVSVAVSEIFDDRTVLQNAAGLWRRLFADECGAHSLHGHHSDLHRHTDRCKGGCRVMDVVKQWTLNICLTLIGAVILSLVSPRGSMGRFYKTVLSLFIIAGFLLPITGGEKADFSAYFSDVTAQAADANSVYESQIESRVKQTLTAAGYKDCSVQASVRIKEQEIYIQKLVVSVPGDMDREAVAALLKAQLGLQPVVKGLGE